jgi:selenoprotein W-related protein
MNKLPTITIEYCPKCGWMLRAAYMAQELLNTFSDDVHGVLLQPSVVNGRYTIRINSTAKEQAVSPKLKNSSKWCATWLARVKVWAIRINRIESPVLSKLFHFYLHTVK